MNKIISILLALLFPCVAMGAGLTVSTTGGLATNLTSVNTTNLGTTTVNGPWSGPFAPITNNQSGAVLSNLIVRSGTGANTFMVTNSQGTNLVLDLSNHTNGTTSILWSRTPGDGVYAGIYGITDHGFSMTDPSSFEQAFLTIGNYSWGWGIQNANIRHLQIGINFPNESQSHVSWNEWIYLQGNSMFGTTPGYSVPFTAKASMGGGGTDFYPGMIASTYTNDGHYELRFLRDLNATAGALSDSWSILTVKDGAAYYAYTNDLKYGFKVFGGEVKQSVVSSASTASTQLDFGTNYHSDITVTATNTAFFTTNSFGGSTNYEKRVFTIRSGGGIPTLSWPTNWNVLGLSAGGSLPTTLQSGQLIRLEIESIGSGESNKLVSALVSTDNAFTWDPDALAFFTTYSVTNTVEKSALNYLYTNLKANSFWPTNTTNGFLYADLNTNTWLKNSFNTNLYAATAGGTMTNLPSGFNSDGSTGYIDTGFNMNTVLPALESNVTFYVFAATNNAPAGSAFVAGATISGRRMAVRWTLSTWNESGVNDNTAEGTVLVLDGGVALSRTNNSTKLLYSTVGLNAVTRDSVGVPNGNIYLCARNDTGSAADFYRGQIRSAMLIPMGITSAQRTTLFGIFSTYNNLLNRGNL